MTMNGYDQERVMKISQIMPQFASVAEAGDRVLMGLEGDPLFSFDGNRPSAQVLNVEQRAHDALVSLKMDDGNIKQVSTMSLAADEVWEFDDATFKNVMDRQAKMHQRAESPVLEPEPAPEVPEYRGKDDELSLLRAEVQDLKDMLNFERQNQRNFHNTMIASLNEMAGDICKLDSNGQNTEFCRVLNSEYTKLIESRAESVLPEYRGSENEDEEDEEEEEEEEEEEDFSADSTDFF